MEETEKVKHSNKHSNDENQASDFKYSDPLIIFLWLLIVSTVSCARSPYSETTTAGLENLKHLCEKDAGLIIYQTVNADGYYNDTTQCLQCFDALLVEPLQYIEFCSDGTKKSSNYLIKNSGCYRLTKEKKDSGQCHAGIDARYAKFAAEPYVSFKQDNCIKVEVIKEPSLGLGLYVKNERNVVVGDKFDISRSEHIIKSTKTNDIYARNINYSLGVHTVNGARYGCDRKYYKGYEEHIENQGYLNIRRFFIKSVIKFNEESGD
jgi:hypothetical protein